MAEKKEKPNKKQRIVLDMSQNSVSRLDFLKEAIEAESRAAVFRQALRLYEWVITQEKEGMSVYIGNMEEEPAGLTKIKIFAG